MWSRSPKHAYLHDCPVIYRMGQNNCIPNSLSQFCRNQYLPADFYRAMLCIRGTSHGPVSVCPCLSEVGVLLKRQNVHKQHHTYPRDSSFLMPKISAKFDRGHPHGGAKCRWGGQNRRLSTTGYISNTV